MDTFKAKYVLAVNAGYKVNIVRINHNEFDPPVTKVKSNYPDVEITRPHNPNELKLLHTRGLVTANGYIQNTEMYDDRLFIKGLTNQLLKSKNNHLGILSFADGNTDIIKTKFAVEDIHTDSNQHHMSKILLKAPRELSEGFLVLGGYIILENENYLYRRSEDTLVLRLDRLAYIERLFELARYTNIWEKLGVEVSAVNPGAVDQEELFSLETVTKLLTLDNTFFVEVPGYSLTTDRTYLEHTSIPGCFRTEEDPQQPLIAGVGKICEFTKYKGTETKFEVNTTDAYYNNYLFTRASITGLGIINDHRLVGETYRLSNAFFLNLKYDKL